MMYDMTMAEALAKREHLIALGETTIYLRKDADFPFDRVAHVADGSTWRLNGPSSVYLIAEVDGLTFKMSVDFERPEANGASASQFDRDRLRELMDRLSDAGRAAFAKLLETRVLPAIEKRTAEFRAVMQAQRDSEDCVRGLIAFANGRRSAA